MNLVHLMPLSATWAGPARNGHLDRPPLFQAETSGTTPFRFSTHLGDVGHMLVVGGLTTKIQAIVDALGNPVALSLTPGQASDISQAKPLLDKVEPCPFLADKACDADALIQALEKRDITPVIPSKANRLVPRQTDFALYCERNLVDRFFNKIKRFRAIATRYDKLATTYLAVVQLVAALIWLN